MAIAVLLCSHDYMMFNNTKKNFVEYTADKRPSMQLSKIVINHCRTNFAQNHLKNLPVMQQKTFHTPSE
jgi:hypothetical protein